MSRRIAVLSAGSWGTAFGAVLADAGNRVLLHARRPELAEAINTTRENPRYLPGINLPDSLTATTDAAKATDGAEFLIVSIPAQTLRDNLTQWAPLITKDTVIVSLMKGIETGTGLRMSEVITDVTGVPAERVAVVSGPNLAREIADRQPAASVIACRDEGAAARLQAAAQTPYFRPYTNTDVTGCELGGAVKNVIALAVGLATGMGLGDNTRAVLVTRGLAETARLGIALGADPLTFSGLAGVGDLMATCASPLSRNRTFGEHLGRGLTLAEATAATSQTAEGVKSAESVFQLARHHDVEMAHHRSRRQRPARPDHHQRGRSPADGAQPEARALRVLIRQAPDATAGGGNHAASGSRVAAMGTSTMGTQSSEPIRSSPEVGAGFCR